jgi:hypothetical protein
MDNNNANNRKNCHHRCRCFTEKCIQNYRSVPTFNQKSQAEGERIIDSVANQQHLDPFKEGRDKRRAFLGHIK